MPHELQIGVCAGGAEELERLVNAIPGGVASYRVEEGRFIPLYYSDGVAALTGHSRAEFFDWVGEDAMVSIYQEDRDRVLAAAGTALERGGILDVSYRTRHKDGRLVWIHLNGRRMETTLGGTGFCAVLTGISAETRLVESIADETADGIYVISKTDYTLLYVNENRMLFRRGEDWEGKPCYAALHGREEPCPFCTLKTHSADGVAHEMAVEGTDRWYSTRFRETDWNGTPAYIKYVQDVTEEVEARREMERMEVYFQTIIRYLPGGIAVIRYTKDGVMVPEYLSHGFAEMTGMSLEEAWQLYQADAMTGIHHEDRERVEREIAKYIASGESHTQITYRLRRGDGDYVWVKNTLTVIQSEGGEGRVYADYHDMTQERQEQARLRQQYNELILQHYRTPGPNALIVGHCNITQNRILEIQDYTNSDLLAALGTVREDFFRGVADLVVDPEERQAFLDCYLNAPALDAFRQGRTEVILTCFIQLPKREKGCYVEFKVNLVSAPDTGDITGILTVTDVTEQTISAQILRRLSVDSYDIVADVDLTADSYTLLTGSFRDEPTGGGGSYSRRVKRILAHVLPKDRARTARLLDPAYLMDRLKRERVYSCPSSIIGVDGQVLTENMMVFATDLRLGRVCVATTDITASVREQQRLLAVIAYTFELLALIEVSTGRLTQYTRTTVLENLPPTVIEGLENAAEGLKGFGDPEGDPEMLKYFQLETLLARLAETPAGYDFVVPYRAGGELRYKQINVLWGDISHQTVCMVRADVTDMLMAERQSKGALEKALILAEEASQAKSQFLSSMSHDIRTPMNAIMGMTALAVASLDDRARVEDCLRKITAASKHLLSLINDILDMSKIECSKITLNRMVVYLPDLVEQLSVMLAPQARSGGLTFDSRLEGVEHLRCYGDALRISQILINLLANAIKFTPEGGRVSFRVEELPAQRGGAWARYRFTVADSGMGMSEEFQAHLFEPFTRNQSTARVEGSGLGLSITKGLVNLMEGEVSVESRPFGGTTFRVELECETAAEEDVDAPMGESSVPKAERTLAGRRFLVAEDNVINAEILSELLRMQGALTVVKPDGAQAVHAFQTESPGTYDAILMDIQMPELNGYEATRRIRALERPDAAVIPIVAMTANAFAEDVQASLDAGMTAHVAKPIDVNVLYETLNRMLGG